MKVFFERIDECIDLNKVPSFWFEDKDANGMQTLKLNQDNGEVFYIQVNNAEKKEFLNVYKSEYTVKYIGTKKDDGSISLLQENDVLKARIEALEMELDDATNILKEMAKNGLSLPDKVNELIGALSVHEDTIGGLSLEEIK